MKKKLYLLYGEENYLINEKIKQIKKPVEGDPFNLEIIDWNTSSLEGLSNALLTSPLLGGDKVVIINNYIDGDDEQDGVIDALQKTPSNVAVAFVAESIDKRSKFYRYFNDAGEVIECKPFSSFEQQELAGWVVNRVKKEGKRISESNANLLIEVVGLDLYTLVSEIEKLATYIGEKDEISEEDVLLVASRGSRNAFALLDALQKKDLKNALSVFSSLMRNHEEIFPLIGLIASGFRLMLMIKSAPPNDRDPFKIARDAGSSPYFVKRWMGGANHYSLQELTAGMGHLLEAGQKIKMGMPQEVVFEMLLTSLCGA